ncbi:MAG TPA: hypothetical protein ENK05_14570 [Gammaproteobacteria bacterium]|nr:hypothetical protein [Gammaproteobacteria bacterium]
MKCIPYALCPLLLALSSAMASAATTGTGQARTTANPEIPLDELALDLRPQCDLYLYNASAVALAAGAASGVPGEGSQGGDTT